MPRSKKDKKKDKKDKKAEQKRPSIVHPSILMSRERQQQTSQQQQQHQRGSTRQPQTPTQSQQQQQSTATNRRPMSPGSLLVHLLSAANRCSGKRRNRDGEISSSSSSDDDDDDSIYLEFEEEEDDDEDEVLSTHINTKRSSSKSRQQQQHVEGEDMFDDEEIEDPDIDEEDDYDDDSDDDGEDYILLEEASSSDDEDEEATDHRSKSRSRSRRSNSRRSAHLQEDDDEEEEDDEDDDGDNGNQLVIEAEMSGDHDPRETRRVLNQLTSAAAHLARVCPNFTGMRVVLPQNNSSSSNNEHNPATSRFLLPPRDLRQFAHDAPTIVVDLDETLVQGRRDDARPIIRPHVEDLVAALRRSGAEVVIWTAGGSEYAQSLLNAIMNHRPRNNSNNNNTTVGKFWHHLLTRETCLQRWLDEGVGRGYGGAGAADSSVVLSVKDLAWLGRPVERCLVIENSPVSVVRQPGNAFLVPDFHQANSGDRSLAIAAEIVGAVVHSLNSQPHHHRPADSSANTVPRALQRCQQLESSGFRIPGLRSVVTVKTLTYSPHGVARTFGEEPQF